jgi:hypothetical protein
MIASERDARARRVQAGPGALAALAQRTWRVDSRALETP